MSKTQTRPTDVRVGTGPHDLLRAYAPSRNQSTLTVSTDPADPNIKLRSLVCEETQPLQLSGPSEDVFWTINGCDHVNFKALKKSDIVHGKGPHHVIWTSQFDLRKSLVFHPKQVGVDQSDSSLELNIACVTRSQIDTLMLDKDLPVCYIINHNLTVIGRIEYQGGVSILTWC